MVNTSLKRRRTEEQLRGKTPKKEKKKIKKQKYYHSSSEDEGGARDAPVDFKPVSLQDSDEENDTPFEPTGANATVPKMPAPKHTVKIPAKFAMKKSASTIQIAKEASPHPESPSSAEDEDDEPDVSDSDKDISDASSLSETSTTTPRKIRKRNDPSAFATSISKILSTKLTATKRSEPILSRSKDAQTANREIADSKLTEKARRQVIAEKKAAAEKGRVKDVLGLNDAAVSTEDVTAQERELRRTAQKGVIKLFNAVRAAQVKGELAEKANREKGVVGMGKREEQVKEMSKQGFLDMITGKGTKDESVEM